MPYTSRQRLIAGSLLRPAASARARCAHAAVVAAVIVAVVAASAAPAAAAAVSPQAGSAGGPPVGLLALDDGSLIGVTESGGSNGDGTVFRRGRFGWVRVLYAFDGSHGANPLAGAALGADGNYYGTTSAGGANGYGTIYRLTPDGTLTVLHDFTAMDGTPQAALLLASDGNFYGTLGARIAGGDVGPPQYVNYGSLFRITPGGDFTNLHNFDVGSANPVSALIQGSDGNLYGSTGVIWDLEDPHPFPLTWGTLFRATLSGDVTTLHSFDGSDGSAPSRLVQAPDGSFYGTAESAWEWMATPSLGTIFRLSADGSSFSTVHEFTGGADSADPVGGLVLGTDGNFYGSTDVIVGAGAPTTGTLFRMTADGQVTTLHTFPSGQAIEGVPLVLSGRDRLFGSTGSTLFELTPRGRTATVWSFGAPPPPSSS